MTPELRQFARIGAQTRLAELNAETANIYAIFPDLRTSPVEAPGNGAPARRTRRPWTAKERAVIAKRMAKYWRARRAAQKDA